LSKVQFLSGKVSEMHGNAADHDDHCTINKGPGEQNFNSAFGISLGIHNKTAGQGCEHHEGRNDKKPHQELSCLQALHIFNW
ncbi:MAG: hypothetical protein ACYCZO_04855, partial [Daejeonella sp.]